MPHDRHALVLGATGVVGRSMLQHLTQVGGWEVSAVSRRKPDIAGDYRHVAVDLTDRAATLAALGMPFTHVFYAPYIERPTAAEMVGLNLAMLTNVMDAVEPNSPRLAHVNLMQGSKWYGSHLGPYRTPAREDDPRHMPPNFYYDQQDFIAARQQGKRWSWSAARPHAVCGFATGNPMNLVMAIAVYAAVSKQLGIPLRFPGSAANYRALYQCTDSSLLARGVTWMSTASACANQAFNLTNGDLIRWENLWPRFARYFGTDEGPPLHLNLARTMAEKGPVWDAIVAAHGLQKIPYETIVSWNYADFVFSAGYDIASNMTKAREYGFHDVVDTEKMFFRLFDELRANKIIP
jgi:nucleoside-diphosphate-sugar epimerase